VKLALTSLVAVVIAVALLHGQGAQANQFESPLPIPQEQQASDALVSLAAERGVTLTAYGPLAEVARAYAWTQAQAMRCTSDYALLHRLLADYGLPATSTYVRCIPQWVEPAHLTAGLRLNEEYAAAELNATRPYIGVGYAYLDSIWRTVVIAEDVSLTTQAVGGAGEAQPSRTYLPAVR
jgi:hypothetical protein